MHFLDESNMFDRSARFPRTRDRPPNRIDFPAPVSPVIHVIPSEKSTSKSSIIAKFFIFNLVSKSDFFKEQNIQNYALICFHLLPKNGAIFFKTSSVFLKSTFGPSWNKFTISSTLASKNNCNKNAFGLL